MNGHELIDTAAAIGKINIERSCLFRDEKEMEKHQTDLEASLLKSIVPVENAKNTVMGMNREQIRQYKATARKYDLDELVFVPSPNRGDGPLILMRGGNVAGFACDMGITLTNLHNAGNVQRINLQEEQYGVIIYRRH